MNLSILKFALCLLLLFAAHINADTVALWLFDEQEGLYPSCVLGDAASGDFPLVIGLGGQLKEGKFGRGLEPTVQPDRNVITEQISQDIGGMLRQLASSSGQPATSSILSWSNALFCGLMTRGERHLRQEVDFGSPTEGRLNLGAFDWTIEFWFLPMAPRGQDGAGQDGAGQTALDKMALCWNWGRGRADRINR